ncbi:transcription antiterminator BglG [Lachnoclostridium sp. An14]|uniref:BglG family transcription antiterminator n=1 Tax=Lachnoclostridium sp. An14 TaxID=1965562 RepID=UPI000B3AD13E|nr:PTS sugar transporter subunit IIA [Lachnoclostridium sp. An14]OUQ14300.1 transcription antiterminator BglG [Lachnoclostridium sp. An14]
MLSKRQSHIIDLLNNEMGPMTGKALGKALGVSDRTIRSDVEGINSEYGCELIRASRRNGYYVDHELMKAQNISSQEVIPQTAQERCVYLIKELLFRNREINLIDLQERVFVSGYSIDNDLRKIREMIRKYPGLKLVRSKNHIRLLGDEGDKRRLYKELLMEETKGNFVNLNAIAEIWKDFDLLKLEDDFAEICEKYGYRISEMEYPLIMLHAGVSIERMRNHNYVSEEETLEEGEGREYQIADELFARISDIYKVKLVKDEVLRFAGLLKGKDRLPKAEARKAEEDEGMQQLMRDILEILRNEFDIDLSGDQDFQSGIIAHIRLLMKRQQNQVTANDLYLQELKRKYPLVFEMAVRVAWCIEGYCGTRLNENEISFLALHLGAACERMDASEQYRVVAIIPNSYTMSKPCVDKLMLRFGDRMSIVRVCSFFEERRILQDNPDMILTTVPLKHHMDIPTVQISLFLNGEDESRVFQMLNLLDREKYHKDFVNLMERLMRKDLFHIRPSMESREEILNFLCDSLYEKGLSGEKFKENVFRREALSDTSFVYGFAVPHAIEASTMESCISIMILREPVKWGDFNVSLVVLLAIRETDNSLLKVFFDWLCNIVTDNNKFQELIHSSSYEEFMNHVIR